MEKQISLKIIALLFLIFITACVNKKQNADRFKQGVFEIPEGKGYSKTIITRIDSLQIEKYEKISTITENGQAKEKRTKRIDTLYITWKNNFAYTLKLKNPKSDLDKDAIFVQINKVDENSYDFTAKIGYSNYKQKGTLYKVK